MQENNSVKEHSWGIEINWANKEDYSGKIIIIHKSGSKTPVMISKNSSKTWFVNSGSVKVRWIDTNDGRTYESILQEGNTYDIEPMRAVSLEANSDNVSITEVSNNKDEKDFYLNAV